MPTSHQIMGEEGAAEGGAKAAGGAELFSKQRLILIWAVLSSIIAFALIIAVAARGSPEPLAPEEPPKIRWCSTGPKEQEKCKKFATAMEDNTGLTTKLECVEGVSINDCVNRIKEGEADALTLDGGDIAKNKESLKPVVAEDYGEGPASYWAVAVAKASTNASVSLTVDGLMNKKSCHTGYEKTAGWNFPIGTIMSKGIFGALNASDCDPLSLANNFFYAMCVPGSDVACDLCQGSCQKNCEDEDYCGYTGAFRCLVESGDVAFVKHTTVLANTDGNNLETWAASLKSSDYQLLCPDGTRAPVTAFLECNLGRAPSHAVVVSKDAPSELAPRIQEFLEVAELRFGYQSSDEDNDDSSDKFQLFGGSEKDLIFKSSTKRLLPLADECESNGFLGEEYLNVLSFVNTCEEDNITIDNDDCLLPQNREEAREDLRWCVVNDPEYQKCEDLKQFVNSEDVKTDLQLSCVNGTGSVIDPTAKCAQLISENDADVMSMDGGDIFQYSRKYNLQPLTAELYTSDPAKRPGASYYAVAVVLESFKGNFRNLENRRTCHTGYGKTAGWVMPIGTLAESGYLTFNQSTCNVVDSVRNFFNASCIPGIRDQDSSGVLCSLCKNNDCSKSSYYSGYSGALKCINERAGEVAFIKHTTIQDERQEPSRYRLLCPDGSRNTVSNYERCNLARVPAHALMTAPHKTAQYREKVWSFLKKLQLEHSSSFPLFSSSKYGFSDLLFKDSTKCLGKVDQSCKWQDFLGESYLNAARKLRCVNNPPQHDFRPCQISTCPNS